MQLEELRMAPAGGSGDPGLRLSLQSAREKFERRLQALGDELQSAWNDWDTLLDRGAAPGSPERTRARDRMVDILNRRSYIRNLVRDVTAALEE